MVPISSQMFFGMVAMISSLRADISQAIPWFYAHCDIVARSIGQEKSLLDSWMTSKYKKEVRAVFMKLGEAPCENNCP